jgi:hypothetical protein
MKFRGRSRSDGNAGTGPRNQPSKGSHSNQEKTPANKNQDHSFVRNETFETFISEYKASNEAQETINDKTLFVGAYARS